MSKESFGFSGTKSFKESFGFSGIERSSYSKEINSKIPVWVIIITITLFLFILVFIANKAVIYDKSIDPETLVRKVPKIYRNLAPLKYIKSEDALIFSLEKLDDESLIFLAGDFDESSLTLWNNNSRVYNKILNSAYGIVFYKNKNLISQGFYNIPYIYEGENVLKNIAIDVQTICSNETDCFVSVNNYSKTKIYIYNPKKNTKSLLNEIEDVNIEIETHLKNYDYSEYGVTNYVKSDIKYQNVRKMIPNRNQNLWIYDLKAYTKYLFVYHKSKYNLCIKYNDEVIYDSQKSSISDNPDLVMLEFNPNSDSQISVQNLDEKIDEKNINSDFVDAIYAPYYAYEQFVYGKKQKIVTSKNRINFKVCLFEIL
jgi:hypothetical protein